MSHEHRPPRDPEAERAARVITALDTALSSPSTRDPMQTAAKIEVLFRSYVGRGPVDLERLRACIARDCREAEAGHVAVTPGRMTELRADRTFVGFVWNERERAKVRP